MISIHSTIREINPRDWNRLSDGNAFATHGWLRTAELCWRAPWQALYFTLHREGVLAGAAVCHISEATPGVETLDDLVLGRLQPAAARAGISLLPAMVCGTPQGYGWHIGTDPATPSVAREAAWEDLLDAIEAEADRRGLPLSFLQVVREEESLRNLLLRRRYLASRNVPVAVMDIPWRSLDDYLAGLTKKRRRDFRREMRRNREAGVEIALLDSHKGLEDRLLELFEENARTHRSIGFPFGRDLFESLHRNMADGSRLFVARKSDAVVGVYLVLREGSAAIAYAVGVDAAQGDDFTYFQLVYYGLIEHAIENGIDRVYFGRGMYASKVRRGCHLSDAFTYTRVSGPRRWLRAPLYGLASAWNRAKVSLELRQ